MWNLFCNYKDRVVKVRRDCILFCAGVLKRLMQRANSLEKTQMPGEIEGKGKRGNGAWDGQTASPTQWLWIWVNSNSGGQRSLAGCSPRGHEELGTTERLGWGCLKNPLFWWPFQWRIEFCCGKSTGLPAMITVASWFQGQGSLQAFEYPGYPRKHWSRQLCWRREWLPTQVFLHGDFHGQRSLVGYSPWGSWRIRHYWVTHTHTHTHTHTQTIIIHTEMAPKPWARHFISPHSQWSQLATDKADTGINLRNLSLEIEFVESLCCAHSVEPNSLRPRGL